MVFHFREWVTNAHSQKVPIDEMILVWGGGGFGWHKLTKIQLGLSLAGCHFLT